MAPRTQKPDDYQLPGRIPVLLRHSWYALNQAFRRRITHLGLTPDQFTVLRNLFEKPGLTQRELCLRMASDPNTVAALTARMAEEGWIERAECTEDRRANRLKVLAKGRRKFGAANQIAQKLQEEVSSSLTSAEFTVAVGLLTKLADGCRGALKNSPQNLGAARVRQTRRPALKVPD